MHERADSIRLAELAGAVSLATDLASGQPLEHGLRRALLAVRLGEACGMSNGELRTAYYVALLGGLGCVVNTAAIAPFVQDEIRVRGEMFTEDLTRPLPTLLFLATRVGAGESLPVRVSKMLRISRSDAVFRDVALHIGGMLELGEEIQSALGQCEEHWNGKGGALGLKRDEIAQSARLFLLAQDADVFSRLGGPDAAISAIRERSDTYYDPSLVEVFCREGTSLLNHVQNSQAWDLVVASEPEPVRLLDADQADGIARQIGSLVDMRSHFTLGHSSKVADLAAGGSDTLGLSDWETSLVRRAGYLHDLGRLSVPITTWHRPGALTGSEWQAMRSHPAVTELLLSKAVTLGPVGSTSGLHHERCDGSGYRGATRAALPLTASLLATADAYQTKLEPRPHRSPLTLEQAADVLNHEAREGKLDSHVIEAVLAGGRRTGSSPRKPAPCGLTEREVEVLRLAVQGLTNREIGQRLVVSPKTVGHHIENIYAKIGVATRVGATMFAVKHRLVDL